MPRPIDWAKRPYVWIELFAFANISFLAVDTFFAHSVNNCEDPAEWTPVAFSTLGCVALAVALIADLRGTRRAWTALGAIVGAVAVLVGIAGMLLHLNSQFFQDETIKHLVYTAPFAAPLAYTGLGFLLIMNRMVADDTREWAWWVVFFAAGGFAGNFVLSLADHAQNGFFFKIEWIAVFAGAIGFAFLLTPLIVRVERRFYRRCMLVMAGEALVGLLGFVLHVRGDLLGPGASLWDRIIYGAPVFAPLLFPNLALLGVIGLWAMERRAASAPEPSAGHAHQASTP